MSTDRINRGILIAMAVIGLIVYVLLYGHASTAFRALVPFGLLALVGLVVRDVLRDRRR
ncbi:hypothetical protein [Mycobacterium sp. E2462]|uniref:hypothetical protein n=1 Tax=Mycobacterium sp. E2462 TaxID=1834133 RepID=UPI000A51B8E3|nr:hypothetical protein [Mycobacterium sp. E2462]